MWKVENLNIWNKAIDLSKTIYILTQNNVFFKKDFWLKEQVQRCSISIASNIAE